MIYLNCLFSRYTVMLQARKTSAMQSSIRTILVVIGILLIGLSIGYFWQQPWAVQTWPWDQKPLSYAFVASMQAAIAAACLWIAMTGELGVLAAGALNLVVMMGGLAIYLGLLGLEAREWQTGIYAAACAFFTAINFLIFLWARRIPILNDQPMPSLIRISYVVFVLALVLVGGALVLDMPNILPWAVSAPTSIILGWMFLGDAFYFLYALLQPRWYGACAQLWSFLAYDLVLLGPFLLRLSKVEPLYYDNLLVYIGILLYSAALAIYYLFINRTTRVLSTWPTRPMA